MKKLPTTVQLVLFIISVTAFGCKKSTTDSKPAPSDPASSQWTFNGNSYKATDVNYDDLYHTLEASDDAGAVDGGNYVEVVFGSAVRPSESITLTVVDADAPSNPSNCLVFVGNIYDTYYRLGHASTGRAGDKVVVTISPSGKLKTNFTNITVISGPTATDTLHVSGTIVEK